MEIKSIMDSIDELRLKIGQSFLEMVLEEGWQKSLFEYSKKQMNNKNNPFYENYRRVFYEMAKNDTSPDSFSCEKMDITMINTVFHTPLIKKNHNSLINKNDIVDKERLRILDMMGTIAEDKNETQSHRTGHEDEKTLFQRASIYLRDLSDFLETVSKDRTIDADSIQQYVQQFYPEIELISSRLEEERFFYEKVEDDINSLLQANKTKNAVSSVEYINDWHRKQMEYMKRYCNDSNDSKEKYYCFITKASDAGITSAHSEAALYYLEKGNIEEYEKRLRMMLQDSGNSRPCVKMILDIANKYIWKKGKVSDTINEIVKKLEDGGHTMLIDEYGYYHLEKVERKPPAFPMT